jgi:hypothetical protein
MIQVGNLIQLKNLHRAMRDKIDKKIAIKFKEGKSRKKFETNVKCGLTFDNQVSPNP